MRSLRLTTRHKIALAASASLVICAARRMAGLGTMVEVVRAGLRWKLDLREGIDLAIYLFGRFERATFRRYRRHVKPGSIVLDIGANIGAHTLPLALLAGPQGRVFAFEPTGYAYSKLTANIACNPQLEARIRTEQMMLTASDTEQIPETVASSWPLFSDPARHALHRGVSKSTAGARTGTLDMYVREHSIERVDFVKLDVDGHECSVLAGALRTLQRCTPVIAFEIAPYALEEHGGSLGELMGQLTSLGYLLVNEGDDTPLPDAVTLGKMLAPGTSINVVGRPVS
jgi:FkbM family methyltransferase